MLRTLSRVLALPRVYSWFSDNCAGAGARRRFVAEYVRPEPGLRVLDIGCGPGDIVDDLGEVDYVGFDISEDYIRKARAVRGSRARFEHVPVEKVAPGRFTGFDLALAVGVLHHLDDEAASNLVAVAAAALKPGGRFVTLEGVFYDGQPWLEHFVISQDRGRFVRTVEAYRRICETRFADVRHTVLKGRLRIPFAHIVMEARKDRPDGIPGGGSQSRAAP